MRTLGVEATCIGEIELAVTEACTNVLKHVVGTDVQYEVSVEIDDRRCQIRISDGGGGDNSFDHSSHGYTEADADAESGRGIFLMRAMVDELSFHSVPNDGTIVHLVKHLELEEGSVLRTLAVG
jgi:serine/threonine-protein kinase RsbW